MSIGSSTSGSFILPPVPPPSPRERFYPPDPVEFPPLPDLSSLSKPESHLPNGGLNYVW